MRKVLITILLIAVSNVLFAQNQFSGTVKNQDTGEPVFSASVYFPKLEKGTTTDESGHFTIKNLPSGNYKLGSAELYFQK